MLCTDNKMKNKIKIRTKEYVGLNTKSVGQFSCSDIADVSEIWRIHSPESISTNINKHLFGSKLM